jgi:MFS family permease
VALLDRQGRSTARAGREPENGRLRRNRDFLLLWTGQAVGATGLSMTGVVYPLLALAATRSATLAGVVGFAGLFTAALTRLPAGVLADRYPLKPLMVGPELVRAASAAWVMGMVLAGHVTLTQLVVAAVLGGASGAVFDAAQTVAIRHVVTPEQLPQALAQDAARGHVAGLVGQPSGGYLYAAGAAVPFLASAISSLVCAGLTALVRHPMRTGRGPARLGTLWADIPVGLRHVASSAFLRVTLACAAGFNVVFAGLTIAVIASQGARGASAAHLGVALSMGALGGILGAWAAPAMNRRLRPPVLVSLFGWTCCVALALLGQVDDAYLAGGLLAVMSFVATPANATLFAAQIAITPPELQGRVVSAAMLAAGVAAPVGPPVAGLLLDSAGQAPTFLVLAAVAAALTLLMQASAPVRTMQRPGSDDDGPTGEGGAGPGRGGDPRVPIHGS